MNSVQLYFSSFGVSVPTLHWIHKKAYMVSEELLRVAQQLNEHVVSMGTYMGYVRGEHFFPSLACVDYLSEHALTNTVVVDDKSAWLFTCKRDVFEDSILEKKGEGPLFLVFSMHNQCVGIGLYKKKM
ncbi:MAG: hypothetical protein ACMXYC_04690, partial [Candidatus Woesearchaeota archaeon]